MNAPEPRAGSDHYREGWRHGYEQAAIDRERSADAGRLVPATLNSELQVGSVPDTGQARELRVIHPRERDDMAAALHSAECDCGDRPHHERETGADYNQLATAAIKHARIASGDTAQAADAADLAYARSEVDKWLASNDPYCILPTRTEHIPALLGRLDELEGTS